MALPDSFNETVSSLLERKVRGWLSGVIDDMRRSSPVQQWLDSLPVDSVANIEKPEEHKLVPKSEDIKPEAVKTSARDADDKDYVKLEVPILKEPSKRSLDSNILLGTQQSSTVKKTFQRDHSVQSEGLPRHRNPLLRDHSLQSDASGSSGSSVLNVLGARKVDAESVLIALGFGPSEKQQKLQRIPDRFLIPSKMKGISTEQFIKDEHHSMRMHDCGIFGYRGLTGNPHVPPSTIVAKIMDCILQGDLCREEALRKVRHSIADMRSAPAVHAQIASRLHK